MFDHSVLLHIILCTAVLIIMFLAGFQAAVLLIQDFYLRKYKSSLISVLPPIETLEKYFFKTLFIGWLLLSFVIISSLVFFKKQFLFSSTEIMLKTLLTFLCWLIFSILLAGRAFGGWRGKTVILGTFLGFLILVLIYLGASIWFHG